MLFSSVFGHKAYVHTSDAPSPGPSLRNYTSDLKNALAHAHTHTNTHRHAYPPFLSCFHCFSVSFQRGVWSPRGSVQLRRRPRPCQSPSVFLDEGEFLFPTPLPALPQARRYRDLELRCPKPRLCILRPPGILALVV